MVTAVDLEEFCLRLLLAALTFIETHKTTNRATVDLVQLLTAD
jgi:hypothetical protein